MSRIALALALLPLGCAGTSTPLESPLLDVAETDRWVMPGQTAPAFVITTEGGVPHVFAQNREDLARIQGFVVARERFFQVDLVRRLSQGTLSSLLGDLMREADLEARGISMTFHTDALVERFTPEQREIMQAYADGFNAYIQAVEQNRLPAPSEYELLGPLLGADDPEELMEPFSLRDVAAIGGTILFRLGYETNEINDTRDVLAFDTHFEGRPLEALRTDALWEIYNDQSPVYDEPSANGFGARRAARANHRPRPARVESGMLDRLANRMERLQQRWGRDHEEGWGSNAWAVAGSHTTDGRTLMAGDGHLELDIPPLMMQIGLDTAHLGTGFSQAGLVLVGMPILSVGTNGHVAWSTTQHSGDITDWYAEELQLDADGWPTHSRWQGDWSPLVRRDEVLDIAGRLGSVARSETWPRFETFDGRWITAIEGRSVGDPEDVGAGEVVLNVAGDWVVPGDEDGDGIITAVSFDFAGLDKGNLFAQFDGLGTAENVAEVHEAMRMGLALSQNIIAADAAGDVYYSGYQMVPCRGYLPRNGDGTWVDGASPRLLLDGNTYGGFTIPIGEDFKAIEGDPDPSRCVIPFEEYPHSFTPERGFLLTANQDPGGLVSDGTVLNDPIYIGGPWDDGYRADTIARGLQDAIDEGGADLAAMSALQGNHESVVARRHLDEFLGAIEFAADLVGTTPAVDSSDARILEIYEANEARFDEVLSRLSAWQDRGLDAASGVATFYHPAVSAEEADDAVATMIFNVWLGDIMDRVLDDERLPGAAWQGGGSAGKLRALDRMFASRGPGNPLGIAGYNPDTEEHVFFDIRNSTEIETSDEVLLIALNNALDFLESAPTGDGEGGFGTTDMDAWLWGLRHQVEFGSLVASYVDDPLLGGIFDRFAIDTEKLPLEASLDPTDPRSELTWFPRPGDNRNVDAANPGLSGRRFRHGSGPVMRMAFALGEGQVEGVNIIPGGQSGIVDSPNFSDQAALWLANETLPVHLGAEDVSAHGLSRETFVPGNFAGLP